MLEFSAADAWRSVNDTNPQSRWKSVVARAGSGAVLGNFNENVSLKPKDDIFCVGSCFAKNIERKLVEAGFRVLSHPIFAPPGEPFAALPNVFNIRSIVNEFRWGLSNATPRPEDAFVADDQGYLYDPHSTVDSFRGLADVVRRRRAGVTANMRRLRDCRIVVLTLGLVEVWYDRRTELYLNATLPRFLLERDPQRYALRVLDYADCLDGLEEAHHLLRRFGRADVEIFLSVSPVPLAATFTPSDVLTANTYSKSTQVAAACDFARRHDNVHYVPSYESVINSARRFAWRSDLRHVTEPMIDHVTAMFIASQITGGANIHLPARADGETDWPIDPTEIEKRDDLPRFFSATPGDRAFPAGFPVVTCSSALAQEHDASCLMSASKRIWHAQRPPTYPEWLDLRFEKPLAVGRLFLQNQDGHPERSPTALKLDAHVGDEWLTILNISGAQWHYGGEWLAWPVERTVDSSEFRLYILANNGDPNLLTVQNLYFSP
jgi:GSCFA family protein